MKKLIFILILCSIGGLVVSLSQLSSGQAGGQYPIADKVADKVIQKYQTSSCQQLAMEKQQPPPAQKEAMEQRAVELLHSDAQLRQHFLNKIAGPVVNKMFECGFIP
jgi:hypothetical protein